VVEILHSFVGNIHPLFSSGRILKIGSYLRKLLPKVWWLPFWNSVETVGDWLEMRILEAFGV